MSSEPSRDLHSDDPLGEIAFACLETLERGVPLDKAAVVARHPEFAAELSGFFEDLEQVDRFAEPLRSIARAAVTHPVFLNTTEVSADNDLPRTFGNYELLREIGRGGMGVVYRASQKSPDRLVALKMIQPGRLVTVTEGRRFRNEAEAAAQLDHPHIVPIYEVGDHQGQLYFTMKLIEGDSLATLARNPKRGVPVRHEVQLVSTIARAVHHAHQRGILHRDLKPSNILIDSQGEPYVADFGLAKQLGRNDALTLSGAVLGTPAYMAPEQVSHTRTSSHVSRADEVTTAADVYGLGAILYALLTGRPPFESFSPLETLALVKTQNPTPPSQCNPTVDRDLESVCLKCLEKEPERRYSSAAELAEDLERWLRGEPTRARPLGMTERARRWCRRNPVLAGMIGAIVLLTTFTVTALIMALVVVHHERQAADRHRINAETNAANLRQRLYASQMAFGLRQAERGEFDDLMSLLGQFEDDPGLQGFEWRWMRELAQSAPREVVTYRGHQGTVFGASFSPDGKTVASTGEDRSIQLWNAATAAPQFTLWPNPEAVSLPVKGHQEDENCVRFSPDGRQLASASEDGAVRLWDLDLKQWQPVVPPGGREMLSVEFSPDGRLLAAAGLDGVIRVFNLSALRSCVELTGHRDAVTCVAFSPDSQTLASVSKDGSLKFWDVGQGIVRLSIQTNAIQLSVAYAPDSSLVAIGSDKGEVRFLQAATGAEVRGSVLYPHRVRSICFSPDGTLLAAGGDDGCVRVISVRAGEAWSSFRAHVGTVWAVQFGREGRRLLTAGSDRIAKVWELAPRPLVVRTGAVSQAVFAPRGDLLAATTPDGHILLGDADFPNSIEAIPVRAIPESALAFSGDGSRLAFVSHERAVHCWRVTERREEVIFVGSPGTELEFAL